MEFIDIILKTQPAVKEIALKTLSRNGNQALNRMIKRSTSHESDAITALTIKRVINMLSDVTGVIPMINFKRKINTQIMPDYAFVGQDIKGRPITATTTAQVNVLGLIFESEIKWKGKPIVLDPPIWIKDGVNMIGDDPERYQEVEQWLIFIRNHDESIGGVFEKMTDSDIMCPEKISYTKKEEIEKHGEVTIHEGLSDEQQFFRGFQLPYIPENNGMIFWAIINSGAVSQYLRSITCEAEYPKGLPTLSGMQFRDTHGYSISAEILISKYMFIYFVLFGQTEYNKIKHIKNPKRFEAMVSPSQLAKIKETADIMTNSNKQQRENTCVHIPILNEFYETLSLTSLKGLKTFFKDKKTDKFHQCKICGFPLICSHYDELIKHQDDTFEIMKERMLPYTTTSSGTRFTNFGCNICGEIIYSEDSSISRRGVDFILSNEERILYWKAAKEGLKYATFKILINEPRFIREMIAICQPIITKFLDKLIRREDYLDRVVRIAKYVFVAYLLVMTKNGNVLYNIKELIGSVGQLYKKSAQSVIQRAKILLPKKIHQSVTLTHKTHEYDHIYYNPIIKYYVETTDEPITYEQLIRNITSKQIHVYKLFKPLPAVISGDTEISKLSTKIPRGVFDKIIAQYQSTKQKTKKIIEIKEQPMLIADIIADTKLTEKIKQLAIIERRNPTGYNPSERKKPFIKETVDLYHIYGENGKKHIWNKLILKSGETVSRKKLLTMGGSASMVADKYSEGTSTRKSEIKQIDVMKIKRSLMLATEKREVIKRFTLNCPEGGSHDYKEDIEECTKCGLGAIMTELYFEKYKNTKVKKIEETNDEPIKIADEKITMIDPKDSTKLLERYSYSGTLVTDLAKILKKPIRFIKFLGCIFGLDFKKLTEGLIVPEYPTVINSFQMMRLDHYIIDVFFRELNKIGVTGGIRNEYQKVKNALNDENIDETLKHKTLLMFLYKNIMEQDETFVTMVMGRILEMDERTANIRYARMEYKAKLYASLESDEVANIPETSTKFEKYLQTI